MEKIKDIRALYQAFNKKQKRRLIFHVGIDAGFFAEYSYMIHGMLWAASHGYRFCLYSSDANFSTQGTGWDEYFEPFCPEVKETFHSSLNVHPLPPTLTLLERAWKAPDSGTRHKALALVRFKLKSALKNRLGHLLCLWHYRERTLLTYDADLDVDPYYNIPGLRLKGSYLEAFRFMTQVAWHPSAPVREEIRRLLQPLSLPARYLGIQLRGGDKATEVDLLPLETLAEQLAARDESDILALCDDFTLLQRMRALLPGRHIHSLCRKDECGYVNNAFTSTPPHEKRARFLRFLAQIEALRGSTLFVGSITTGPSLFLLKVMGKKGQAIDCERDCFAYASHQPIARRGEIARDFLKKDDHVSPL